MRVFLLISMTVFLFSTMSCAQTNNKKMEKAVKATFMEYVKGADQSDATALEAVLHPDFRSAVNQLFGADGVSVMDKATYLELTKTKKIGGTKRKIEIEQVDINNSIATIKAVLTSDELKFTGYYSLVQDKAGKWWVLQDMPVIEKI